MDASRLGISTASPIEKYSPRQPRDNRGRFADGASVGVGPNTKGVGTPAASVMSVIDGLPHYGHGVPNDSDVAQADAFEKMAHDPSDPRVAESYAAFESTLTDQWKFLADKGFTYEPQGDAPGYANSNEMLSALEGKHMRVYLTEGGGDFPADHPMLKPMEGIEGLGPRPVLNDVFRAVHDTIGHGVSGGSFGVSGERAAWIAHRATFPKEALPALWNETRGQAAWTNAGPHMQKLDPLGRKTVLGKGEPGYIALPDRPFSEQKAGWPEGASS